MTRSARVLTGLMERRALEAAFSELAETKDLDQLSARAQAIAHYGSAAIPVLVSLLDTIDPQVRGGLGQVAALLDREQVAAALRHVARAQDRSDQARLTALMILDRFLGELVDESLLTGLQDPAAVAVQSLRELGHEMAGNPFVVIEYLNQLAEQPREVGQVVLEAMRQLPMDPNLIILLRMFAQGPDWNLAHAALEQLSRTRSAEAAGALASLAATLPPDLAILAQRGVRKLRLSGVEAAPAGTAADWRALLSPIDGSGAQVIWFVGKPGSNGRGTLFSILTRDPEGIFACFGSSEVPAEDLPPEQPLGSTYLIRQTSDAPAISLLEVPLEAGRQAVRDALELNRAANSAPPMEYRLLNPWIWELGPLEAVAAPAAIPSSASQTATLLDHPAFANWFWQARPVYEAAESLGRRHSAVSRQAQVETLANAHFGPELMASYQRRLSAMARWLALAARPEIAGLAQTASVQLAAIRPAESPLIRRLIGMGLDVAIANLRSGFDLRKHPASPL